jgi:hypothetical protein
MLEPRTEPTGHTVDQHRSGHLLLQDNDQFCEPDTFHFDFVERTMKPWEINIPARGT